MRCKCCNTMDAEFWQDDYYCPPCLTAIKKSVRKAVDENAPDDGDLPMLMEDWDEDNE